MLIGESTVVINLFVPTLSFSFDVVSLGCETQERCKHILVMKVIYLLLCVIGQICLLLLCKTQTQFVQLKTNDKKLSLNDSRLKV